MSSIFLQTWFVTNVEARPSPNAFPPDTSLTVAIVEVITPVKIGIPYLRATDCFFSLVFDAETAIAVEPSGRASPKATSVRAEPLARSLTLSTYSLPSCIVARLILSVAF